jgi:hypothetical protein
VFGNDQGEPVEVDLIAKTAGEVFYIVVWLVIGWFRVDCPIQLDQLGKRRTSLGRVELSDGCGLGQTGRPTMLSWYTRSIRSRASAQRLGTMLRRHW